MLVKEEYDDNFTFLKIGVTLAIFSSSGNIPATRDWLIVTVNGPKIFDLMDFIKWVDS